MVFERADRRERMSFSKGAWLVAVSVGAVEAMKNQECVRSLQQHAKNHARSMSHAEKLSSHSQSSAAVPQARDHEKMYHQVDESMRKVMYLSCWGSN